MQLSIQDTSNVRLLLQIHTSAVMLQIINGQKAPFLQCKKATDINQWMKTFIIHCSGYQYAESMKVL